MINLKVEFGLEDEVVVDAVHPHLGPADVLQSIIGHLRLG